MTLPTGRIIRSAAILHAKRRAATETPEQRDWARQSMLTVEAAARTVGLKPGALRHHIRQRHLPAITSADAPYPLLIDPSDLMTFATTYLLNKPNTTYARQAKKRKVTA